MTAPTNPIDILATRDGYDYWAEIYDSEDNPLIALEERFLPAILGSVAGLDAVDIGCGTGRHALALAAAGARVTALDFSTRMLARARTKPGAAAIRFVEHDLHQPFPLAGAAFDRVLCCLVLEHITDLGAFFRELVRICRPGGAVVISAMHPAMMLRGTSARFQHPTTGRDTRPESHAHQVSDFVRAALATGATICDLYEHAVDQELAARSPRAAKYLGWPMLFLMRLKPPGCAPCE